jgi:Calx-beta domain-containing protein
VGLVTGAVLLARPVPADANCHIATWDLNKIRTTEAVGQIELAIELDGRGDVACTGSVKWTTANGSAEAPGDYTASSGELKWTPGSPRRRTIKIPIVNDTVVEGGETFTVTMTAGGGGIQVEQVGPGEGGPTAAVFIADDDGTPSPSATATASTPPGALPASSRGTAGSSGLIVGIVAGLLVLGALTGLWLRRRRA